MTEPQSPWRTRKPSREPSTPLGQWLKRGLDKAGMSQYRLAQLMNRSESFVQKIYDGRTKQPRRDNLEALAELLSFQWAPLDPQERKQYLEDGLYAAYWTESGLPGNGKHEAGPIEAPPRTPDPPVPTSSPRRPRRRGVRLRYHGPEVTVNGPEDVVIGSGTARFVIQGRYRSITIRGMASVEEVQVQKFPSSRKSRSKRTRSAASKTTPEPSEPKASSNGSAHPLLYPEGSPPA